MGRVFLPLFWVIRDLEVLNGRQGLNSNPVSPELVGDLVEGDPVLLVAIDALHNFLDGLGLVSPFPVSYHCYVVA